MKSTDPAFWRRVEALFDGVISHPQTQRDEILKHLREGEPEVYREVRRLLEWDARGSQAEPQSSPETPHLENPCFDIEGYRLEHTLGKGGMGTVYLAHRLGPGGEARVAVKVLERGPGDPELELFKRESQTLARLEHPAIARFLDSGTTTEGVPFFVLEYVEGLAIDRFCDLQRLPIKDRVQLMRQVCSAVQHAHQNLVVHRDLKPGHILITDSGLVKLLDFGIAKDLRQAPGSPTTTANRFLTPAYASPEQIVGKPATTSSDLYSLGLILCLLLCGRTRRVSERLGGLVPGTSPEEEPEAPSRLLQTHRATEPARAELRAIAEARDTKPRHLKRLLRGDLDTVVLRCLERDPQRRYPSAAQLEDDLERFLDGRPILARRPSLLYRGSKLVRRHPGATAALFLMVAGLIGYTILAFRHSRALEAERNAAVEAHREAERATEFLTDTFRLADAVQRVDLVGSQAQEVTVETALEYGAERLGHGFETNPRLQAKLLNALGEIYNNLGNSDRALPLLERSLVLRRALGPGDGASVAESLANLGNALSISGRLRKAEAYLRSALVVASASNPPVGDGALGNHLAHLGQVLLAQHDYEAGEPVLRRALSIRRKHQESAPRPVAESLADLGNLLWLRNDLAGAAVVLQESLDLYQDFAEGNHPGAAYALQSLAFVQAQTGDAEAANASMQRALELRVELQGRLHPETLVALASAGELYALLRRFEAAEAVLREVLTLDRKTKGEKHPEVALDLHSLALVVFEQGRFEEAEGLVREALTISRASWGFESHVTFSHLQTLAHVLHARGQKQQAETYLRRILEFRQEHFPPGNRLIAVTKTGLASALEAQGRASEALPLAREGVQVLDQLRDRGRAHGAFARAVLGSCLGSTGSTEPGRSYLEEALETLEALQGPDSLTVRDVRQRIQRLTP